MARKNEYHKHIEGNKHAEIEIHYQLGGMNYFSGRKEPRAYYIGFSMVELKKENGYTSKSFMLFDKSSFKVNRKIVARQSKKVLQEVKQFVEINLDKLFELYLGDNRRNELLSFIQN